MARSLLALRVCPSGASRRRDESLPLSELIDVEPPYDSSRRTHGIWSRITRPNSSSSLTRSTAGGACSARSSVARAASNARRSPLLQLLRECCWKHRCSGCAACRSSITTSPRWLLPSRKACTSTCGRAGWMTCGCRRGRGSRNRRSGCVRAHRIARGSKCTGARAMVRMSRKWN
jgi:hypothetical protein